MCNNFASRVSADQIAAALDRLVRPLRFSEGAVPNIEPRDDIRIGDTAPIVTWSDGPVLQIAPSAWKGPQGRPVFNYRSEDREFATSARCLIPTDAFYEFTEAEPGQKRKTKWRFTMAGEEWFWIAGIVKDGAWAMLTTGPGPDIAPYHDRQVVVLKPTYGADWLDLRCPAGELLVPSPAGWFNVEKAFP